MKTLADCNGTNLRCMHTNLAETMIATAPVAIAMFDTEMKYLIASGKWIADNGFQNKNIIGFHHSGFVPGSLAICRQVQLECILGNQPKKIEQTLVKIDGSITWVTWNITPWQTNDNQTGGVIIYSQDITEQKKAEELLIVTNKVAGVGGWEYNLADKSIYWTEVTKEIHEVSPDFIPDLATGINFYKKGKSRDTISRLMTEAVTHGTPYITELQLVTATQKEIWVEARGKTEFFNGKCLRVYGTFQDISHRRQAEANALQLASIVAFSDDAIISTDPNGIILTWNAGARELFGYEAEEITGRPFATLIPESHKADETFILTTLKEGKLIRHFETVRVTKQGRLLNISTTISPIKNSEGEVVSMSRIIRDITEQKETQKAKQHAAERLAIATNAAGVGIWEYDIIDKGLTWDDNMYHIYGIKPQNFKGAYEAWEESLHPEDKDRSVTALEAAIEGKEAFNTTFRVVTPEKNIRYIHAQAIVQRDSQGLPLKMIGTNWDITHNILREEKLRLSEEMFRLSFEHAPIGKVIVALPGGELINVNKAVIDIFGYAKDEIMAIGFKNISHPDDIHINISSKAVSDLISGKIEVLHTKKRYLHKEGHVVWTESTSAIVKDETGKPQHIISQLKNITREKILEDNLRQSEESFRGAFEYAAIGMALIGVDGKWLTVNKSLCNIVGYTISELMQLTFQDITHPDDLTKDLALLNELIAGTRGSYQMEKRYYHKNGSLVWVILAVSMVKDSNGKPVYFISQITDITKEKEAQDRLEETVAQLQGVLDAGNQVSIIGTDENGIINIFNKGAENLLGYTAKEMIGKTDPSLIHDANEVAKRGQELSTMFGKEIKGFDVFVTYAKAGEFESREWTYIRKNGTRLTVQLVVTAVVSATGITGFLGIALDISKIKEAETALESTNKELGVVNAELEQFAFIASHDLQEPLRVITGFISLLERKYDTLLDEKGKEYMHFIEDGAKRMKRIIMDILDYSRTGRIVAAPTLVNIDNLVAAIAEGAYIAVGDIKPEIIWGTLPEIVADATAMQQLFSNLIGNGIKYQPTGNKPIIRIGAEDKQDRWQFSVSDNGIGIDPKFYNKVFIVFQRLHTKASYSGTGIGLAICKKIVLYHKGDIWIDSIAGKGTTFYFTIPKKNQYPK